MKRKSLLFALLFALLAPWAANAQNRTLITIGDGTATNYYPMPGYWGYQYDVYLYTPSVSEELNESDCTISSIAYDLSSINATSGAKIEIWLKDVEADYALAAATTFAQYIDDATKVVDDDEFTTTETGWKTMTFTENFTHEAGMALLVAVRGVGCTGSGGCSRYCRYTTATGMHWYKRADSNDPGQNATGTLDGYRSNIQLDIEPAQSGGDVCEKPATCEVSDVTSTSATLAWTGGSGTYNVEVKGGSYADWTAVLEGTNLTTTTLTLQPVTSYQARVQSVCDGSTPTSGWKSVSFTTPCDSYDIPYTYDFEAEAPFACWTPITGVTRGNSSSNAHNSTYYLRFSGTTSNLVALPQFNEATNNLRVEFWTRPESATNSNCGTFSVGYMTDITDASTFVEVENYAYNDWTSATYVKKTVDFINAPANANIAFRHNAGSTAWYWYADDVTVKAIPSCLAPTSLAANATTNSAELSWTSNSGETAWTVYYKKTTDETYTEVPNATNPYTLNGLDAATNYQYYVVANCSADEASEASEVFTFATACDLIAALGYSENFDSYTAGNNVLPTCWSYINTTTYSSYQGYPRVYANGSYSIYANTAPNCLYFYSYAYYSGGTTTYDPQPQYAILPEMTGLAGLQVTLMAKGSNASSTFKIGTMSDPADASTFQLIAEQTLTTSYNEYSFVVNQQGNYLAIMIDAATESRTSNGVYIDDISIDNVPTCIKPTSPLLNTPSSRTAHTATLKWTNGEEGQTAWQIAYSTSATFAPAANFTPGEGEGLVDADANPYTINGLQASTTYYAYVRANCGDGDLSAWSRTKATFTTTAATAVPTGLAVDASTITSNSATATWTGVATNDLHESFELYLSTEATMPEELVAENLITGITANSYEFTGLAAETTYYVWVRDNCGSDGLSAWSSRTSFTTASSCPTPDGLAESNVTTNSATITWNTHGFTGFNLRYGTDGENWNTIEDVNTPYTLNDLTSSTTYQVQVQATCADAETWSTVLSFTTACDAITDLPWNENFDAYTGSTNTTAPTGYPNDELPMCWQFLNRSNTTSSYPQVFISSNSGYPVSGNCLFFKSSSTTPLYAILPAFEEEIAGLQLTFTYRNEGLSDFNGTLIVGYMTDPADATTFTTVLTCERTTTLTENEVLFTNAPVGSYIAFKYEGGSYNNYYLSIDNVKVEVIPTCTKPSALECTATTTTTATFSWTENGEATAWQICLNGDETNLIMADSNPFTVEDLTASTAYTAKVRAYCSEEDQSDWSNEVSFATNCETIVVTDSWSEDFEDGDMPVCWSQYGDGTWTVGTGDYSTTTGAHTGTYNAKINHNTNGNVTKLITPVLDITSLNNPTLNFWYINRKWVNDIDGFAVYYRTASDADWTLIEATEEAHETWTETTYTLPNPSATYQIAFEMTDGYGYGVGIDDVTVSAFVPSTVTQTIELVEGWNNISIYLAIEDPVAMLDQLKEGLGENALTIEGSEGYTEFDGEEWFGDLDELGITNEQSYMINVLNSCTVELEGMPANPTDYEISISQGWNRIGFPSAEELEVAVALSEFVAEEGDMLEGPDGYTEFDGEEWFGDIEMMVPGMGYQYFSNSDEPKTLVFHFGRKGNLKRK